MVFETDESVLFIKVSSIQRCPDREWYGINVTFSVYVHGSAYENGCLVYDMCTTASDCAVLITLSPSLSVCVCRKTTHRQCVEVREQEMALNSTYHSTNALTQYIHYT